jgi:esterase/lipase superfamily enzyme
MANEVHATWLREGVKQWNFRRKKVNFKPDLSGIRFFDFLPPDYRDSPKTSRFFERIDLSDASLSGADLSDLNFSGSKFDRSDLSYADMSMSNFNKCSFKGASLENANAKLSFFDDAIFDLSRLNEADFEGANALRAIFVATELRFVRNLPARISDILIFSTLSEYKGYEKQKKNRDHLELGRPDAQVRLATTDDREKKISYDVFFATNRNEVFQRGELVEFGTENAGKITYGVSEVIIPENHRVGSIGSPLWRRLLNRRDDRLKVANIVSLTDELYWSLVRDTASRMKNKANPTIFIHGFKTSFNDAVVRAAQIGYDLGIGQGVGLFSWPSKGKLLGYISDEDMVEVSRFFLADYIESFAINSPTKEINIIAHSMGCRCLVGAIEVLAARKSKSLNSIHQMILAAADVNQVAMKSQLKSLSSKFGRITAYASDSDQALKVSGWLHSFPRVGLAPPTFVLSGVDTVVINDQDLGDFSHGYLGSSRTVLGDVFYLLQHNLTPKDRHSLQEVSDSSGIYWRIKA